MMVKKTKKNILQLFILILALVMCWNFGSAADEKPDYWPTKAWRSASPESQGVDSNLFLNVKRNSSKTPASRITQGVYCCYGH